MDHRSDAMPRMPEGDGRAPVCTGGAELLLLADFPELEDADVDACAPGTDCSSSLIWASKLLPLAERSAPALNCSRLFRTSLRVWESSRALCVSSISDCSVTRDLPLAVWSCSFSASSFCFFCWMLSCARAAISERF